VQDLLATALARDAPTGKRSLDVPIRRLRGACARRDAWQRLGDGACSRHATAPVRGHVRAAPPCMRAPRLGACCPARAAPWRLRPCARLRLGVTYTAPPARRPRLLVTTKYPDFVPLPVVGPLDDSN
jgi:hypothetical protein